MNVEKFEIKILNERKDSKKKYVAYKYLIYGDGEEGEKAKQGMAYNFQGLADLIKREGEEKILISEEIKEELAREIKNYKKMCGEKKADYEKSLEVKV